MVLTEASHRVLTKIGGMYPRRRRVDSFFVLISLRVSNTGGDFPSRLNSPITSSVDRFGSERIAFQMQGGLLKVIVMQRWRTYCESFSTSATDPRCDTSCEWLCRTSRYVDRKRCLQHPFLGTTMGHEAYRQARREVGCEKLRWQSNRCVHLGGEARYLSTGRTGRLRYTFWRRVPDW